MAFVGGEQGTERQVLDSSASETLMLPFSEGSSGVPMLLKFHSTLRWIISFVCLLNRLFLHSFIQQHVSNHCIFFPELTEARIYNVKIQ